MGRMQYGSDYKKIPAYSKDSGELTEVLPDLCTYTDKIVNLHMAGNPEGGRFVLVDAGLPVYYTTDWEMAHASVEKLASVEPETAVFGHGRALKGGELRKDLGKLADDFEEIAVPSHGRYVGDGDG